MPQIQFYHLTTTPLERAMPKLLEKAYGSGAKILLVARDEARLEALNQLLWTYDPASFLPHGSMADGHVEKQPILLSTDYAAPNGATIMVTPDGAIPPAPETFERILDIFDGGNEEALAAARNRWKYYKEANIPVSYMRQTENGSWQAG